MDESTTIAVDRKLPGLAVRMRLPAIVGWLIAVQASGFTWR
jgi:hypothetical protein